MVLTKVIVLDGSQALALARLSLDHSREHFTAALLILVEELLAAAALDPPLATLVREFKRELFGVCAVGDATAFRGTGLGSLADNFDSRLAAGDLTATDGC